jgi:hypothetical protein
LSACYMSECCPESICRRRWARPCCARAPASSAFHVASHSGVPIGTRDTVLPRDRFHIELIGRGSAIGDPSAVSARPASATKRRLGYFEPRHSFRAVAGSDLCQTRTGRRCPRFRAARTARPESPPTAARCARRTRGYGGLGRPRDGADHTLTLADRPTKLPVGPRSRSEVRVRRGSARGSPLARRQQ